MPLRDFIKMLFGSSSHSRRKPGYTDPLLPGVDMELRMLKYIYSRPITISLQRDEFIMDIQRFKDMLKSIGIKGSKTAQSYLSKVKSKGKRFKIQENLLNLYLHKSKVSGEKNIIWERAFKEMADIIEESGFGKIDLEDFTHAGTAYDMLIILYVSSICFIVGYIDVIEYKCYTSYTINTCSGVFKTTEEYCKSYLIGKGLSETNGKDVRKSSFMLSEYLSA